MCEREVPMSLDDVTAVKIERPIFLEATMRYIYVDELVTTHDYTHTLENDSIIL